MLETDVSPELDHTPIAELGMRSSRSVLRSHLQTSVAGYGKSMPARNPTTAIRR
jgi:hypothetical protein